MQVTGSAKPKLEAASESEGSPVTLRILSLCIEQIVRNPEALQRYRDPHGFLNRERRWVSMLAANPAARPDDLALCLALDGDTVVGRLGLYAGSAAYGGRTVRTFWLDGFWLDQNYRSTGAGAMLLLRAISACSSLLACGGPSKELQQLYTACGFAQFGPLKRYLYFYRPGPLATYLVRPKAAVPLASAVARPLLNLYYLSSRLLNRVPAKPSRAFRATVQFGPDLDRLMSARAGNHFPRDVATLNWALTFRRMWAFQIFRDETLVGYCLLKRLRLPGGGPHHLPPMDAGVLLDYYLSETEQSAKRDLVLFCLRFFAAQGVDLLEHQVHGREMEQVCRSVGMVCRGGNKIYYRPPPGAEVPPSEEWFLPLATADVILAGDEEG